MEVYVLDSNFFIQAHRFKLSDRHCIHGFWNKVKQNC
jgi:hypothetical protein